MLPRPYKPGVFVLAALNTVATTFYFNYLFFFLRDTFGFGNRENLWVSALHGFIYVFAAWQGGRFAQRHGYFVSLKLGYALLTIVMLLGTMLNSVMGQLFVLVLYSTALLFTWPALEALATEGESRRGVQRMVGIYNCTWASFAALAFFGGGSFYDASAKTTVFLLPAALFFCEFILASWLGGKTKLAQSAARGSVSIPAGSLPGDELTSTDAGAPSELHPEPEAFRQPVSPRTFLHMAWLANPFAYVAINTLFAVIPAIGAKLGLSPAQVGLFCSVWLFGRFAAFVALWQWSGWHYRFRWLLVGFLGLLVGFLAIVLSSWLWLILIAQLIFGFATGTAYYASLFYSMDVGDAKGEHGGLHEAAIGAGICGGPLIGALALTLTPNTPNVGVWAVGGMLVIGTVALLWLRWRPAR